jgi:hypothetical protein
MTADSKRPASLTPPRPPPIARPSAWPRFHVANLQEEDVAELQETATASGSLLAEVLHELPMVPGRSVDGPVNSLVVRHAIGGRAIVDLASTSRLCGADGQRGHDPKVNSFTLACQSSLVSYQGFRAITPDRRSVGTRRGPSRPGDRVMPSRRRPSRIVTPTRGPTSHTPERRPRRKRRSRRTAARGTSPRARRRYPG